MQKSFEMPGNELDQFEVFPWHHSFETGHPVIDTQHKRLVVLLNKLANTLANNNHHQISETFDALASYAHEHFESEEKIWSEFLGDDEWYKSHQTAHNNFLPAVLELRAEFEDTRLQVATEEIIKFLIRWLAFHIIDEDKRMAIAITEIQKGASVQEAKRVSDEHMGGSMHDLIEAMLSMYEGLSKSAIHLIRERNARLVAENKLLEAYQELEVTSVTDELTGLFNRRHLNEIMARELSRAARGGHALEIYLMDVDNFKKYNDLYGHVEGDAVLKSVANALQASAQRASDFCFRYGGEEFCVIASNPDPETPLGLGQVILENLRALEIPHARNEEYGIVTISIGVRSLVPDPSHDMKTLLGHADEALYQSKTDGRNRMTLYTPSTSNEANSEPS